MTDQEVAALKPDEMVEIDETTARHVDTIKMQAMAIVKLTGATTTEALLALAIAELRQMRGAK